MHVFIHIGLAFLLATVQQEHPAFGERVPERYRLVETLIEYASYYPIEDPAVLKAMRRVPRHAFVTEEFQDYAYVNSPLSIGYEQTISQPFIVAHMSQLLDLGPGNKVLEIGTGSGYQAAILAELCDAVFSIEIVPELGERAAGILGELGYKQARLRIGNGYEGWPEEAPFDRMIVTCAPDSIPPALIDQLAPGGRMVIPVGNPLETQYLVLVRKTKKGQLRKQNQYPVRFVPMTGETEIVDSQD